MDINDISQCEKMVMKVVWDSPEELALQGVMNKVNEENGKAWRPQTVSTFLARLVKKGFLTFYRKGRYSYYQPSISKEEYWRATMQDDAVFFAHGDMGELASALYEDILTPADRKKLKKKIEELAS
jgi:predicted transcriptional regulator